MGDENDVDDHMKSVPWRYQPEKVDVPKAVLGLLVVWVVAMSAIQGGWRALGVLLGMLFAFAAASGVVGGLSKDARRNPWQFILSCLVVATGFWFYFSGSYRSLRTLAWDIGAIAIGGIMGTAVVAIFLALYERNRAQKTNVLATSSQILPVCVVLMGWLSITAVTLWRQDVLPRDPTRFEKIGSAHSIVGPDASRWQSLRVGLALSGGGYRAAVFHAGTLHALEKLGVRVNVLSTVSGGSIIGAYYAVGGDPEVFKDAVADGRFNLKRELSLLHNALRLPFPLTVPVLDVELFPWYEFSRRDVQAGLLRRTLFGDDETWREPEAHLPALIIATTDLTFGQQIGLMPDGAVAIWTDSMAESYRGDAWQASQPLSLSERVAISGGFPLAFPAEPVDVTVISAQGTGTGARSLLLADGGVFDNSGFMLLQAADRLAEDKDARMKSDVFLVSDAGAIFGVEPELGGLAQVVRAADVSSAIARHRGSGEPTKPRVNFSAQDHFIPSAAQFRMYDGRVDQFDGDKGIHLSFNPALGYPQSVLEEIARLMPESKRDDALTAVRQYVSATRGQVVDRSEFAQQLSRFGANESCTPKPSLPGLCEALVLRRMLKSNIAAMLTEFRMASTLDDLPSRDRVDALYALGQLLVYTQWPLMQSAMNAAADNLGGSMPIAE